LENASSWGKKKKKPHPNTLPSYAARKAPPNSFPSNTVRKAPPYTFPSDAARKLHLNNAMLEKFSSSELENNMEVVVVDVDMTKANETDPNIIQNDLAAEHPVLQSRKRGATEDHTEIDNVNIVDKVARISTDNSDQSQPKAPIWMQTHPYNSYVSRYQCMAYVDRPARKLFPSHAQMFNWISNCLDQLIFHCY